MTKRIKWTVELVQKEALKYQTRFDFQQGAGGAYKAALRNGWLNEMCVHMKKGTSEYFIERAKHIHGDKYNYSKVEYTNSDTNVNIICKLHGEFTQKPSTHLSGSGCVKCAYDNKKITNIKKYGQHKALNIQEKTKKTNIERYGVETPFSSKDIQEKIKKTNLERYGVKHPIQNKDIYNKVKKTNLERYGVENPIQNKDIYNKVKKTNLERYGVENPFSSKDIQEKILYNIKKKHGTDYHPKKHMLDKYPYLNDRDWLFEQYIILNKTAEQIRHELKISNWTVCYYLHKHEIQVRHALKHSMKCIQWLESIMAQEGIFIQHAGNIGEFKIPGTRFSADGYCSTNNIVYEFHGDCFHGNPDLYKYDMQCNPFNDLTAKELYDATIERENKIISLGYNLVVMWENDYNLQSPLV